MHSQHSLIQRKICWQCRHAKHRASRRNIIFKKHSFQFFFSIGENHSLTDKAERFLCMIDCFGSLFNAFNVQVRFGLITADVTDFGIFIIDEFCLSVFGEVENNWSRTSGRSDVECTRYGPRDVLGFAYLISPFCNW